MTLGRRQLLVVGTGALCAHAVGCGGQDSTPFVPANVAAGNISELAVGSVHPIKGQSVAICRDNTGIYAMTLICTHQGCDMSGATGVITNSQLLCRCHGSIFDAQGNVVQGPAKDPLQHFMVSEDKDGNLTIHGDQPTSPLTRLPG